MKRVLTFLIFSVLIHSVKSQVAELPTVNDITSYSNPATAFLLIKDAIRGGQFLPYIGPDTADNGMIFGDGAGNKWKRVTSNSKINAQWYGIRTTNADNRKELLAALNYIYNHPAYNTLYIPSDTVGGIYYQVSDSILIRHSIIIEGDGTLGYPVSKLQFGLHKSGFVFSYSYGSNAISVDIKNLYLTAAWDGSYNVNKHGITSNTFIRMYNVCIDQFDGDGIHISACGDTSQGDNNNYGNADGSFLENVTVTYCTNGIFIEGCDANTINVTNSSTNQNRRWGIYDNGFLGNVYIKPHAAFNGVPVISRANSVVLYSGKYYAAKPGFDGYFTDALDSNYNKRPDISPLYWSEVRPMTYGIWDSATRYYSGGPLCIRNANAWSNIIHSYTEGFQPPIYLNPRSKVDGGHNGSGVLNGSFHNIYAGVEHIYNADLLLPKNATNTRHITIGGTDIDYSAPLTVINDADISGSIPAAKFETLNRTGTSLMLKNMYSTGAIGYNITDFNFYAPSLISQLNPAGFKSSADNTMDIGTSATKWKTGYFGTSLWSPLIVGGSSAKGDLILNSTSHPAKGQIVFGISAVYDEVNGYFGINTRSPSAYLDINSDKVRIRTPRTPSSSTDTGNVGDICWDSEFIYICVAANRWKRAALSAW